MKILDAHLHSDPGKADPKGLLSQMAETGIHGGGIFSPEAENPFRGTGHSYEVRMKALEDWTAGFTDRLYPILWIHPMEADALTKAQDAAARGVMAFKIICDSYYVGDDTSMALIHQIAKLGKPIMFHSGILWDGYDSSKYNRPLNWECLIEVPGLRFSLAHCAWPWCDETIAMYGKFLNAYAMNPNISAEMFLDLTPGTPAIYRKELIYKLLNVGYDTPHNIIFGTDCIVNTYQASWAKDWICRDSRLLQENGAGEKIRQLYFGENFRRFLGLTSKDFHHTLPTQDGADTWSLSRENL